MCRWSRSRPNAKSDASDVIMEENTLHKCSSTSAKRIVFNANQRYNILCNIRNRCPTAALTDVSLTHERWFNEKPDVSNLKGFGWKAYVHVPDVKRRIRR